MLAVGGGEVAEGDDGRWCDDEEEDEAVIEHMLVRQRHLYGVLD